MSKPLSAKEKLANTIMILLQEKNLEQISVTQITSACGMTRQMFYHYFRDKYALVEWMFVREYNHLLEHTPKALLYRDHFLNLIRFFQHNLSYYRNALHSSDINSLSHFMERCMINNLNAIVQYLTGKEADEDISFAISFYATAVIQALAKELLHDTKVSSDILCSRIVSAIPQNLGNIIRDQEISLHLLILEEPDL